MISEVIFSLCMNISILAVIAAFLTERTFFRGLLFEQDNESGTWWSRLLLGAIFGAFCILSDYIGMQVTGAIPNARVIGILSAGLLGGPVSGAMTAGIAALHRLLVFPSRASTTACVAASVIHGIIGSAIGAARTGQHRYSNMFLFTVGFASGAIHNLLILLLVHPLEEALHITNTVMIPMLFANSVGMPLFFSIFQSAYKNEDLKAAAKVAQTVRIAENCVPYLEENSISEKTAECVVDTVMNEKCCEACAIAAEGRFLAKSSSFDERLRESRSGKREKYRSLSAPIELDDTSSVRLLMIFRRNSYSERADTEFTAGLAKLLSAQFKVGALEKHKAELGQAELRALQAQINPHFLFNALNTISFFCREKPDKARELLQALSAYFRSSLSDLQKKVPLETELEHVRAYVQLEEARFEERLRVVFETDPEAGGCRVPQLILQPIVENAIHHGAMKRPKGEVRIRTVREEDCTVVDVTDNGRGMAPEVIAALADDRVNALESRSGSGIGLKNVQKRLQGMYGKSSGLQIISGKSGTTVRMRFPNNRTGEADNEDSNS